ncbi:ABC transporter permease [bacterium]|nr:ABC transporter permease [bacterium]
MQKLKKIWAVPEIGILLPLLLCVAFFTWVSPAFLGPESVRAILRALAFVGLIAVGQTFLMIAGEIDLSVGSVAGFCAIASAWLMKTAHWPAAAAIVAAVTLGAALGLVNGWVTVRIGIPAFITTLGMLYIAKGLNYLLCKGYPIYPLPASVQDSALHRPGTEGLCHGRQPRGSSSRRHPHRGGQDRMLCPLRRPRGCGRNSPHGPDQCRPAGNRGGLGARRHRQHRDRRSQPLRRSRHGGGHIPRTSSDAGHSHRSRHHRSEHPLANGRRGRDHD